MNSFADTASKQSEHRKIIKDSSLYFMANLFAQAFGLVRAIFLPVLLAPAQLGVWNLMTVVLGYGANGHLGLLHGMNKLLPGMQSTTHPFEVDKLKFSVFWINLALGILAGAVVLCVSWIAPAIYSVPLRILAALVAVQLLYTYFFCLLRADNKFSLVSIGVALMSAFSTVLILGVAYFFPNRLLGALTGFLGAYSLVVIYWWISSGFSLRILVVGENIKKSFIAGFPIIVLGTVDLFFLSVDRWIIATRLGEVQLGYYAVAIMVSNLLGLVTVSVSNVLFPRMIERYSVKKEAAAAGGLLLKPLVALSLVMILLIGVSSILLPPTISLLLPKYIPSIEAGNVLLPAAFFLAIATISGTYVISINRQGLLMVVQFCAILVALICDYIFVTAGYGISGVAYGTGIGYLVYGCAYLYISVYLATRNRMATVSYCLRLGLPFLIMLLSLITGNALSSPINTHFGLFAEIAMRFFVFGIMVLPVMWFLHRHGELWKLICSESAKVIRI